MLVSLPSLETKSASRAGWAASKLPRGSASSSGGRGRCNARPAPTGTRNVSCPSAARTLSSSSSVAGALTAKASDALEAAHDGSPQDRAVFQNHEQRLPPREHGDDTIRDLGSALELTGRTENQNVSAVGEQHAARRGRNRQRLTLRVYARQCAMTA